VVYGSDYYTALDLALSARVEPNIFKDNKLPQHVQMGMLVPWTELPGMEKLLDQYKSHQIEGMTSFNGVPYSINTTTTASCSIFYNKELLAKAGFSAPPKTWAEFERACIAISKVAPGKTYGMAMPLKFANFYVGNVLGSLVPSYGTFYYDFASGKYNFSLLHEYFEMIQRITAGGGMYPGIESLDDDTFRAQFSEGNIGFIFMSPSYNVGVLYDQFPAKIEWGAAPIPVLNPNKSYYPMGTTATLYSVSDRAKKDGVMNEVSIALQCLLSDDLMSTLYTNGKSLPVRADIIQRSAPSQRQQWNDLAAQSEGAVIQPSFPDAFFSIEGDDVYTAFGKLFTGGNVTSILADLDRRYNAAFDRAVQQGVVKREDFIHPEINQRLIK
jgi:ABC-type glycerol-3-phosphate transport system substrate-binding protein